MFNKYGGFIDLHLLNGKIIAVKSDDDLFQLFKNKVKQILIKADKYGVLGHDEDLKNDK